MNDFTQDSIENRKQWLGADLFKTVSWEATTAPVQGILAELASDQWDINKFAHYLPIYESAFGDRHRPVKMLEIGVSFGGSLELWRKYFTHPDSVIVGIDANEMCETFNDYRNNTHVRAGKQQDFGFLECLVDEFDKFDIILDDGSHVPSYTLKSFQYLFANGLADNGVYLVEDLHTCYSEDCKEPFPDKPWFAGANDGSPQFVEFVKYLIDVSHAHYLQTRTGDGIDRFEPNNPVYQSKFDVWFATKLIKSIEIHDSIVVIRSGQKELPRMIRRWSKERMTTIINENAASYLDNNPHLGQADRDRRDWFSR